MNLIAEADASTFRFYYIYLIIAYVLVCIKMFAYRTISRIIHKNDVPRTAFVGKIGYFNKFRYFLNTTNIQLETVGFIAMTKEEAIKGIEAGIAMAEELKAEGYRLLATGERGIGNTTTSSAVASVLLKQPVETMTGRGAGLSSDGLNRKIEAIKKAIIIK